MSDDTVTPSSGNVFADLGLPDPEGMMLKSEIVVVIRDLMKLTNTNEIMLAYLVQFDVGKISAVLRGQFHKMKPDELLYWVRVLVKRAEGQHERMVRQ